MEHSPTLDEMLITENMDFIIPLKQVGLITRAVLESIRLFYNPRRIIVVSLKVEGDILRRLTPNWNAGVIECVDEELFFQDNFGLTLDDIMEDYDQEKPGDQREFGWWLQQLIKLGCATQIRGISTAYVVWDGNG